MISYTITKKNSTVNLTLCTWDKIFLKLRLKIIFQKYIFEIVTNGRQNVENIGTCGIYSIFQVLEILKLLKLVLLIVKPHTIP